VVIKYNRSVSDAGSVVSTGSQLRDRQLALHIIALASRVGTRAFFDADEFRAELSRAVPFARF
jgi:hypothetical protein